MKNFFTWYPFENSLAVLSMTGEEVRRFLEYAFEQKDPIFNFDSGADILYEVDESKPFGERVHIKSMADGALFSADSIYHVVMNSYRSMGGGNHMMQGLFMAPGIVNAAVKGAVLCAKVSVDRKSVV